MSDSLPPHGLSSPRSSPGQTTEVSSLSLLQGIFPTQGSNPGLLHCRWILYQLSHQGSPLTSVRKLLNRPRLPKILKKAIRAAATRCPLRLFHFHLSSDISLGVCCVSIICLLYVNVISRRAGAVFILHIYVSIAIRIMPVP